MPAVLIVLIVVLVLAVAAGAFLLIRRRRWLKAVRAKGWTFEGSNDEHWYRRFGCPPFDVGYERECKDRVTGSVQGRDFVWFRYTYDAEFGRAGRRLTALGVRLPAALPELYLTPRGGSGVERWLPGYAETGGDARTLVRAADPSFAEAMLGSAFWGQAQQFTGALDLAVDNDFLVACGVDDDPGEIEKYATVLSGLAAAIPHDLVDRFRIEPKRHKDLFHGRDWSWRQNDPRWIEELSGSPFGQGIDRKAVGVVSGTDRGLPFTAFRYEWVTEETRTTRGSDGRTRTRTERVTHEESVLALQLPRPFPQLEVKPNQPGPDGFNFLSGMEKVKLESEEFNRAFHVRAKEPRFAYDILHPRTMEFLLAHRIAFATNGTYLVHYGLTLTTEGIADAAGQLTAIVAAIPGFVWQDLGVASPVQG